jgi:hypothetical protein
MFTSPKHMVCFEMSHRPVLASYVASRDQPSFKTVATRGGTSRMLGSLIRKETSSNTAALPTAIKY